MPDLNEVENIDIAELDLEPEVKITISSQVVTDLGLTKEEAVEFETYQITNRILGPAAGAVLLCPGNQVNTPPDKRCPYYYKCPLRRMGKAPQDKLCPVEKNIVEERFGAWSQEVGSSSESLSESDRSVVSDLTWIELQIQRCQNILAVGEDARLVHTNVTEAVLLDTNEAPITVTSEKVLHMATLRLDQLLIQRRMILKEWMLTPEQKFKIAKETGSLGRGADPTTEQSNKADKLRSAVPTIDV